MDNLFRNQLKALQDQYSFINNKYKELSLRDDLDEFDEDFLRSQISMMINIQEMINIAISSLNR